MRTNVKVLIIGATVLLLGIILGVVLLWRPNIAQSSGQRIHIPDTNLSIQIPSGYQVLGDKLLFIKEEGDSPPTFSLGSMNYSNAYRDQSIEDILPRVFINDYTFPERQNINGIDIFLARYNGETSLDNKPIIIALLLYKDQSVVIHATGTPENADELFDTLKNILSSLEVEK